MMSTGSGIPGGGPEKGEVHTEAPQPIDLVHGHSHTIAHPIHHTTHVLRTSSSGATSVVQIRPVRTFLSPGTPLAGAKTGTMNLPTIVTAAQPSILVNRGAGPLTLVQRTGGTQLSGVGTSQNLSTLQFARGTLLSNVRPSLNPAGQQTNITVTPISASSFGTSIRIGTPLNNGSWIQSTGTQATSFATVRPTTIQVTSRAVRPESGKIIHIPQGGNVQHLTHLQVVDGKGSILKPTTPISVRGTLQQSGSGITLGPIPPFTIRATPIHRPPTSVISATSSAQKVITQPAHGPPIIVNANQKFTQIQNFSSLQRLPPAISIAANGGSTVITGSNPSIVGVSPRQNSGVIISAAGTTTPSQLAKVYPISSRDINTTLVETFINQGHVQVQPQQNHINSPTLTVMPNINAATYSNTSPSTSRSTFVIASSSTSLKNLSPSTHQIVQVQTPVTASAGSIPNYYIESKNLPTNVSIFPSAGKRISVAEGTASEEKRHEKGVTLVTPSVGHMILNSNASGISSDSIPSGGLVAHFAHPIPLQTSSSHSGIQITAHPLAVSKGIPISSVPHSQISIHPHSIHNTVSSAIISTTVTTTMSSAGSVTTTNTSVVTLSLGNIGGNGNGGTAISTITTSTTVSPPCSSVTTSTTCSSAQSPSQTKSTLSPRPSILRKREVGACESNFVPLRAQRNLSVNFTSTGSAPPPGQGHSSVTCSTSPSVLISTVSNKENSQNINLGGGFVNSLSNFGLILNPPINSNNIGGISLGTPTLKKEFQPPNEESSWQSSSSNSSSGSTTISATSETSELPVGETGFVPYQQSTPSVLQTQHVTSNISELMPSGGPQPTLLPFANVNQIQNGIFLRSKPPAPPSPFTSVPPSMPIVSVPNTSLPRHRGPGLAKGRDAKIRSKEVVSPRKKPRKQQLTTSGFIESSSPEISFYQSKRFKRSNENDIVGTLDKALERAVVPSQLSIAPIPPAPPPQPKEERIIYVIQKPRTSIFEANKYVPNLRHNHFKRYSDVKPKDERRPTISDLANQKNVLLKIKGWKLKHLSTQMDRVVESEAEVVQQFNRLLIELSSDDFMSATNVSCSRDLVRIEDLLKGNLQRCKVVRDQLAESKSQVSKVLEHHPRILEVISKHSSKRPVKKREKL